MVSNQEKVMIIRKKSVANPVKSRFAKKISNNKHSHLDSAKNMNIMKLALGIEEC